MLKLDISFLLILCFVGVFGSGLHGPCEKDEQCGIYDTYCKNGTCICRENFIEVVDSCIQLSVPNLKCTMKSECKSTLGGRSICRNSLCACKAFHHLNGTQCVKSRALDEVCESTHQCYCGQNCRDKIECAADKICRCKLGYKQQGTRCISTGIETTENMKIMPLTINLNNSSSYLVILTPTLLLLISTLFVRMI